MAQTPSIADLYAENASIKKSFLVQSLFLKNILEENTHLKNFIRKQK